MTDTGRTAIFTEVLQQMNPDDPQIDHLLQWAANQLSSDLAIYERAKIISLLSQYVKETKISESPRVLISVNNKQLSVNAGETFKLSKEAMRKNESNSIKMRNLSGQKIYFGISAKYEETRNPITSESNTLGIERKYIVPENTSGLLSSNIFKKGSRIREEITLIVARPGQHILVEEKLPAGCIFEQIIENSGQQSPITSDIKNGQITLFLDDVPAGVYRYTYELLAMYKGKYHQPPAITHELRNPKRSGQTAEDQITIID